MIKKGIHLIIWSIFFFAGISEIIGLPVRMLNLMALGLVTVLFLESFRRKKIKFPLLWIMVALMGVTWVSGPLLNGIDPVSAFFFFRQLILLQFLYLFAIANEPDDSIIQFVRKVIIILFLIQPIAAIIKLGTIGPMESYIGTMSMREGSLTTLAVMVPFAYLFGTYLYQQKRRYLILMLLFVIFGLAGEKRAIFVFLPPVLLSMFLFQMYVRKVKAISILKSGFMLAVLGMSLVYTIVRMNPTLNPDGKVGGEFDIAFTVDYVERYANRGTNLNDMSRTQAIQYLSGYLLSQDPLILLFGEGAGKLSEATLDSNKSPIHYYYGIRYGGRMGIAWVFLQIGLVGLILYLYLFIKMLRFVIRYSQDPMTKVIFFGIWISVMLDMMIYSMASIRYFVISGVLFCMFGMIYRQKYRKAFIQQGAGTIEPIKNWE